MDQRTSKQKERQRANYWSQKMQKPSSNPESFPSRSSSQLPSECWFDDACILDMDNFIKTLSSIKAKGVRPDLIGSIITHYASIWLPDDFSSNGLTQFEEPPGSLAASWMKKRFFVETLVNILPPEKDSVPCNFLLRLLGTANMVGVESTYRSELEKRISWQLEEASLKALMIPSFSRGSETLLDVELVVRLVKRFVSFDCEGSKSGVALVKVAKLVDSYLAEAAADANLSLAEFVALAGALPAHARSTDDGLYRAIDTYLKAHPGVSKQERKCLCRLIDSRKLTHEASIHAAQNERLPVRALIQVLFCEQTKLNLHTADWSTHSGSFIGTRSPSSRCLSKREVNAQQMEIRKLKEDVDRLEGQCNAMQVLMERLMAKRKKKGFILWKKLGIPNSTKTVDEVEEEVGFERQTPLDMKASMVEDKTPDKSRKSTS